MSKTPNYDRPTFLGPRVSDEFLVATNYLSGAKERGGTPLVADWNDDGQQTAQVKWLSDTYRYNLENTWSDEYLKLHRDEMFMSSESYDWWDSWWGANMLQSQMAGGQTWVESAARVDLDRKAAGLDSNTAGGGAVGRAVQIATGEGQTGLEHVTSMPAEAGYDAKMRYEMWTEDNPLAAQLFQQTGGSFDTIKGTQNEEQFAYGIRYHNATAQVNSENASFMNDVQKSSMYDWANTIGGFVRDLGADPDFQAELAAEATIALATGGVSLIGTGIRKSAMTAAKLGYQSTARGLLATGSRVKKIAAGAKQNVTLLGLPENVRERWYPMMRGKNTTTNDLFLRGWPLYYGAAATEGSLYMGWSSLERQYLDMERSKAMTGEEQSFSYEMLATDMAMGAAMGPLFFTAMKGIGGGVKGMGWVNTKVNDSNERRARTRRIATSGDKNSPVALLGHNGEAKAYSQWEDQTVSTVQALIDVATGGRSGPVLRMVNIGNLRAKGVDVGDLAIAVAARVDELGGQRVTPMRMAREVDSIVNRLSNKLPEEPNARASYISERARGLMRTALLDSEDGAKVRIAWRKNVTKEGDRSALGSEVNRVIARVVAGTANLADFKRLEKEAVARGIPAYDADTQYRLHQEIGLMIKDLKAKGKTSEFWKNVSSPEAQQALAESMAERGLKGVDVSSPEKLAAVLTEQLQAGKGFMAGGSMYEASADAFRARMGVEKSDVAASDSWNEFVADPSAVAARDEQVETLISNMRDEDLKDMTPEQWRQTWQNMGDAERSLFRDFSAAQEEVMFFTNFSREQAEFRINNEAVKPMKLDAEAKAGLDRATADRVARLDATDTEDSFNAGRANRISALRTMLGRALGARELGSEFLSANDIISLSKNTPFTAEHNGNTRGVRADIFGRVQGKGISTDKAIHELRMQLLLEEAQTWSNRGDVEKIKAVASFRLGEMNKGHMIEGNRIKDELKLASTQARKRFAETGEWAGGHADADSYVDAVVEALGSQRNAKSIEQTVRKALGIQGTKNRDYAANPAFRKFVADLGGGEKAADYLTPEDAARAIADAGSDPYAMRRANDKLSTVRPVSAKEKQKLFEISRVVDLMEQIDGMTPAQIKKARKALEEGDLKKLAHEQFISTTTMKEFADFFGIPQRAGFGQMLSESSNKLYTIDDMIQFVEASKAKSQAGGVHTHDSSMWQDFLWGLNDDIEARYSPTGGLTSGSPTLGASPGGAGDWLNIFYQELMPSIKNLVRASDGQRVAGKTYVAVNGGEVIPGNQLFEPEVDGPNADLVEVYLPGGGTKKFQRKAVVDDKSQGGNISEAGRASESRLFIKEDADDIDVLDYFMREDLSAVREEAAFDLYIRGVRDMMPNYTDETRAGMRDKVVAMAEANDKRFRAFMKELFAGGQYGQGRKTRKDLMQDLLDGEYADLKKKFSDDELGEFVDQFSSAAQDKAAARIGLSVKIDQLSEAFLRPPKSLADLKKLGQEVSDTQGWDPSVAMTMGHLMQTAERRGLGTGEEGFKALLRQLDTSLEKLDAAIAKGVAEGKAADVALAEALPQELFFRESSEAISRVARSANDEIKADLSKLSPTLAKLADQIFGQTFDDQAGRLYYTALGLLDPQGMKYKEGRAAKLAEENQLGPNRTQADLDKLADRQNKNERYGFNVRGTLEDFDAEEAVVKFLTFWRSQDFDISGITGRGQKTYSEFLADERLGLDALAERELGIGRGARGIPSIQNRQHNHSSPTAWSNQQESRTAVKAMAKDLDGAELKTGNDYVGDAGPARKDRDVDVNTLTSPPQVEAELARATGLETRTVDSQAQLDQINGTTTVNAVAREATEQLRSDLDDMLMLIKRKPQRAPARNNLIETALEGEGNFGRRQWSILDLGITGWMKATESETLSGLLASVARADTSLNPVLSHFEAQGRRAPLVPAGRGDVRLAGDGTALLPRVNHSTDARQRRGAAVGMTNDGVKYVRNASGNDRLIFPMLGTPLPTSNNVVIHLPSDFKEMSDSLAETVGTFEGTNLFPSQYRGTGSVMAPADQIAQISGMNSDAMRAAVLVGTSRGNLGASTRVDTQRQFGNDDQGSFDAADVTRRTLAAKQNIPGLATKQDPRKMVDVPGVGRVPLEVIDWTAHSAQMQSAARQTFGGVNGLYKYLNERGGSRYFADAAVRLLGATEKEIADAREFYKSKPRSMSIADQNIGAIKATEASARDRIGAKAYADVRAILPETSLVADIVERTGLSGADVQTILLDPVTYQTREAFAVLSPEHGRIGAQLDEMERELFRDGADPKVVARFSAEMRVLRQALAQMDMDFFQGVNFKFNKVGDAYGQFDPKSNTVGLSLPLYRSGDAESFSAVRIMAHELGHAWFHKAFHGGDTEVLKHVMALTTKEGKVLMADVIESLGRMAGESEESIAWRKKSILEADDAEAILEAQADHFAGLLMRGLDTEVFETAVRQASKKNPSMGDALIDLVRRAMAYVRDHLLLMRGAFERAEGSSAAIKELDDFVKASVMHGNAPRLLASNYSNRVIDPETNAVMRAIEKDHDTTVRNMMIARGEGSDMPDAEFDAFMDRVEAEKLGREDPRGLIQGDHGFVYDPDGVESAYDKLAAGVGENTDAGRVGGMFVTEDRDLENIAQMKIAHEERRKAIVNQIFRWAGNDKVRVAADGSLVSRSLDANPTLRTLTTGMYGSHTSDISTDPVARLMAMLHGGPRTIDTHFDLDGGTPNFMAAKSSAVQATAPALDAYKTLRDHRDPGTGKTVSNETVKVINTMIHRALAFGKDPDFSKLDGLDAQGRKLAADLHNKYREYFREERRIALEAHDPKLYNWGTHRNMPRRGLFDADAWEGVEPIKINGHTVSDVESARAAYVEDDSQFMVRFSEGTAHDQKPYNDYMRARLSDKYGYGLGREAVVELDPILTRSSFQHALDTTTSVSELDRLRDLFFAEGGGRLSDFKARFLDKMPEQMQSTQDRLFNDLVDSITNTNMEEVLRQVRTVERGRKASVSNPAEYNRERARGSKYGNDVELLTSREIFGSQEDAHLFYETDIPKLLLASAEENGYTTRAMSVTYALTGMRGYTHTDFIDDVVDFLAAKATDAKSSKILNGVKHKLHAFHAKQSGGNVYQASADNELLEEISLMARGATMTAASPGFGLLSGVEVLFTLLDNFGSEGGWKNFINNLKVTMKSLAAGLKDNSLDRQALAGQEAVFMEASGAAADRIMWESTEGAHGTLGVPTDFGAGARVGQAWSGVKAGAKGVITGSNEQGKGRLGSFAQAVQGVGQMMTESGGLPKMTRISRANTLATFRRSLLADVMEDDGRLWTMRDNIQAWREANQGEELSPAQFKKIAKESGYPRWDWPLMLQKSGVFQPGALEDLKSVFKRYDEATGRDTSAKDIGWDPNDMYAVVSRLGDDLPPSERATLARQRELMDRVNNTSVELMNQRTTQGYGWDDAQLNPTINSALGKMFFSLMSFTTDFANQRVYNTAGMPFLGRLLPSIALYMALETIIRSIREIGRDDDKFFEQLEQDPVGTLVTMGVTSYPFMGPFGAGLPTFMANTLRGTDTYKENMPGVADNFRDPYTFDAIGTNAPIAFVNRWFKQFNRAATRGVDGRWMYDTLKMAGPLNHPLVYTAANSLGLSKSDLGRKNDRSMQNVTVPGGYTPRPPSRGAATLPNADTQMTPVSGEPLARPEIQETNTANQQSDLFSGIPEEAPDELA